MRVLLRLALAVAPLALSVLFAWASAEGHLNFGGGEKDILLAAPLFLWSLVYLIACLVLWARSASLKRTTLISAAIATALIAIAWIALFAASWLGYA